MRNSAWNTLGRREPAPSCHFHCLARNQRERILTRLSTSAIMAQSNQGALLLAERYCFEPFPGATGGPASKGPDANEDVEHSPSIRTGFQRQEGRFARVETVFEGRVPRYVLLREGCRVENTPVVLPRAIPLQCQRSHTQTQKVE